MASVTKGGVGMRVVGDGVSGARKGEAETERVCVRLKVLLGVAYGNGELLNGSGWACGASGEREAGGLRCEGDLRKSGSCSAYVVSLCDARVGLCTVKKGCGS